MNQTIYTGATALQAQTTKMSVIANNIANASTEGFKKSRVNTESLMYQHVRQPGVEVGDATMPSGLAIGVGTRVASTQEIFTQGGFKQTDGDLDLAINGQGFFQIMMPTGEIGYTRAGGFQVDAEGNVVTPAGHLLEPQITIPEDAQSINVSPQGVVSVKLPGQPELQQVGVLELARFINPAGLVNKGGNTYLESGASGAPIVGEPAGDGYGSIGQGQLETSNVSIAEEMVSLIETQRTYEMASKAVSAGSDASKQLIDSMR